MASLLLSVKSFCAWFSAVIVCSQKRHLADCWYFLYSAHVYPMW